MVTAVSEPQSTVTKSKKMRLEKKYLAKKISPETDPKMVTIISVRLKNKSSLRKEIYVDLKKKSGTPRKKRVRSKRKLYH